MCHVSSDAHYRVRALSKWRLEAKKGGAEETSELVKTKLKHFSSSRLSPEELLC